MIRITLTIDAATPFGLVRAAKQFVGIVTSWHIGRCRGDLNLRRSEPGWLMRVEDDSLEVELERSTGVKGKLRIVR